MNALSEGKFSHLLSPLQIGPKTVRNRVLITAHVPGLAENGNPGDRYIAYHRERAAGGAGMQVTGATAVHASSGLSKTVALENVDDSIIPGYQKLSQAVHAEGGTILAQLAHYGAMHKSDTAGHPLWAPSPVAADLARETPHEMSIGEIKEVIESFAQAAVRVRKGGLDGVEVLGAFGLLIAAFMSPYANHRRDQYGGSLKNRMRLALEVINAVRQAVGPDMIVGIRIPGDEMTEGGLDQLAMLEIARVLEASQQLDYLNIIAGTNLDRIMRAAHWPPTPAPHGLFVPLAAAIRKVVTLPVFVTGRITDPHMAEQIMIDGHADMVGMTRAHIADPEIVRKISEGKAKDIRPCDGANVCIARALDGQAIRCLYNTQAGREFERKALGKVRKTKKVAVIGAGPAGLEAARISALRGHEVTIYEKESYIGGQFSMRCAIPAWAEFQKSLDWMRGQLDALSVPIKLGHIFQAEMLKSLNPDAVIMATGATPVNATIDGSDASPIRLINPHDFIMDSNSHWGNVLVWDHAGGIIGAGAQDAVASRVRGFHIVTPCFAVAEDINVIIRVPMYERLLSSGAIFVANSRVLAVDGRDVIVENLYSLDKTRIQDVDTIVAWVGSNANTQLEKHIIGAGVEYFTAGDCVAPRTAELAFAEGAMVGRRV